MQRWQSEPTDGKVVGTLSYLSMYLFMYLSIIHVFDYLSI